jgi:hypothetical protein
VAVAGRLDLIDQPLLGASAAWWALPPAVVLTCLAMLFRRPWATAILSLSVGLSALGLAAAVIRSPLELQLGAQVALLAGAVSVVGALIVIAQQRRGT